jgi:hypothetical protein
MCCSHPGDIVFYGNSVLHFILFWCCLILLGVHFTGGLPFVAIYVVTDLTFHFWRHSPCITFWCSATSLYYHSGNFTGGCLWPVLLHFWEGYGCSGLMEEWSVNIEVTGKEIYSDLSLGCCCFGGCSDPVGMGSLRYTYCLLFCLGYLPCFCTMITSEQLLWALGRPVTLHLLFSGLPFVVYCVWLDLGEPRWCLGWIPFHSTISIQLFLLLL